MPTIVLTNCYSDEVLSLVNKFIPEGFNLVSLEDLSKASLLKTAPLADYFLVSGRLMIDKDVIENAHKLKMIQRTGVGLDCIDIFSLKNKNIPLYVNHGINARSVAEHTIMLILAVLRKITVTNRLTKQGKWVKNSHGLQTHSLNRMKVGLIGLGNIGIEVAKLLIPFGCEVIYYKRNPLKAQEEIALGVRAVGFNELIRESNIISLHCPLNDNTRYTLNQSVFEKMRSGSFIINTARGSLIDEKALAEHMRNGHIAGAGLDVFEEEPANQDNELFELDNVIVSAHVSGITKESYENLMINAIKNIVAFHHGDLKEIEDKRVIF